MSEAAAKRRSRDGDWRSYSGKPPIQSPQGLQIVIVDRQFPNLLIKLNGMPQANFRLLNAAGDARVARRIECGHGNLGLYGLRPQRIAAGLFDPRNAPDRIGEFHSARSPRSPELSP